MQPAARSSRLRPTDQIPLRVNHSPMSSDRCNGVQHNVYLQHSYRPDGSTPYADFGRNLSWASTPANVPGIAQRSDRLYDPLHPLSHVPQTISYSTGFGEFVRNDPRKFRSISPRKSGLLRSSTASGSLGYGGLVEPSKGRPFGTPALEVTKTMKRYTPTREIGGTSRAIARASTPLAHSRSEGNADAFFAGGRLRTAVSIYDQALREQPDDVWVLTKRCAALCHVGDYEKAHADAQQLNRLTPSPQSRLRVNAISKYLATTYRSNAAVGHERAHITLLQLVTPSAFKQW